MGAIASLLPPKIESSPAESDAFVVSSTSNEMANFNPRSTTKPQINEQQIPEETMRRYSASLKDVKELLDNMEAILKHQRKLETDLELCQGRLRQLSGDHARISESNVENIASANRPSALERKYEQFYDHERMDAVDAIESSRLGKKGDKWTETYSDQYVACLIFEESYNAAWFLRNCFLDGINVILMSAPAIGSQYCEASKKKHSKQFSFSIDTSRLGGHQQSTVSQISENSLKVIVKETAENCDVFPLVEKTVAALIKLQESGVFKDYATDFWRTQKVYKYVEKCCKYTWKLVCQNPPYQVEGNFGLAKDRKAFFDEASHQVCRDLKPSHHTSQYIRAVIWPGLFDGSSRRAIRKTEVVLIEK